MIIYLYFSKLWREKIAVDQDVHLAFVDLEKAYDSIQRALLWEALDVLNINGSLVYTIQNA